MYLTGGFAHLTHHHSNQLTGGQRNDSSAIEGSPAIRRAANPRLRSGSRVSRCDAKRLEAIEHKAHSDRAFTDGRRHPLDRSTADVADAEDPGPARLEQQRHMINTLEFSHWNVGPREHEAVAVKGKLSVEPVGARRRTDEHEQAAHRHGGARVVAVVAQHDAFEHSVSE